MRPPALSEHPSGLLALVGAFTVLRIALAAAAPLLPQEAYYWVWSLHPAWSYFDHPPLAAWTIAVSTAVAGDGVFGIKLAAVAWSLAWNLLLARLLVDMLRSRAAAFWTLLAVNLTLTYEVFGIGITPDSPLLATWIGTVLAVWRATRPDASPWAWGWVGLALGLAWLSKYSAALLVPIVVLFLAMTPRLRRLWRHPGPWLALGIATLLFMPVLIWNAENGWVSLAFQSTRRLEELGRFTPRWLLLLVATQAALLTPWLFWLSIRALVRAGRPAHRAQRLPSEAPDEARVEATRLLWLNAAVPIAVCLLLALRSSVHMNWLAPAWWSLLAIAVPWLLAAHGRRRLVQVLASAGACTVLLLALVTVPGVPLPADLDNWSGWPGVVRVVQDERARQRAQGTPTFVFGSHYKIASLLRFHLPHHPRTFAQDIYGEPALQYDHLPTPYDLAGSTGVLVTGEPDERIRARLAPWFDRVEVVAADALRPDTRRGARRLRVYRCIGYHGYPGAAAGRLAAAT